jgi:AraC-like DNA-binding protein
MQAVETAHSPLPLAPIVSVPEQKIPAIHFHQSTRTRWGLDVVTLDEIRTRAAHTLTAPQRLQFYLLLLLNGGGSAHMVDFEDLTLNGGDALWVRPGQVQQWKLDASLQGTVLLVEPEAMALLQTRAGDDAEFLNLEDWPNQFNLAPSRYQQLQPLLGALAEALRQPPGMKAAAAAVWHLALSLLLQLAGDASHASPAAAHQEVRLVRRLMRALDETVTQRPSVENLCQRLAVSHSTLSRACQATQGVSVKTLIDQRVLLEAKRLLALSPDKISHIAARLGFDETTNFVKFFRRLTQTTPASYRQRYR